MFKNINKKLIWVLFLVFILIFFITITFKIFTKKSENIFVVIPHHSLVNNSINEYYKYLHEKYWNFENIVIISPNHFVRTKVPYISLPISKKYCYKNEKNCINWLNFSFYAWSTYDEGILGKKILTEHWIWNHFEFINKYFSNVKVYSILLKIEKKENEDLKKLEREIEKYNFNWRTLFIASVDFSHHVNEKIAIFHDLKSIDFLNWVWEKPEVDCPNCLYLIKNLANKNWEKYFKLNKRTSTDTELKTNSNYNNTSHIYWEFSNKKSDNNIISNKYNYSKFENNEMWNKNEIFWIFFWDTHFTRDFTKKENTLNIEDYLKCFYQNKDKNKKPEYWHNRMLYSFDFAWFNLESAVTDKNYSLQKKEVNFITDPKYLSYFNNAWFNVMNIANNHILDAWEEGLKDTKVNLEKNNIEYFWNKDILKKEINGTKVAFLWIDDSKWLKTFENEINTIKNLKKEWYLVILNIHWWVEYKSEANSRQKKLAHNFIDSWVNLIIWHHTHVIQNYEIYKWVPIFYSLWNFIFDQSFENTLDWEAVAFSLNSEWIKFNVIKFRKKPKTFEIDCDSLK
jgi:predicted class III extradiol MEMO1 family dioxygenase